MPQSTRNVNINELLSNIDTFETATTNQPKFERFSDKFDIKPRLALKHRFMNIRLDEKQSRMQTELYLPSGNLYTAPDASVSMTLNSNRTPRRQL